MSLTPFFIDGPHKGEDIRINGKDFPHEIHMWKENYVVPYCKHRDVSKTRKDDGIKTAYFHKGHGEYSVINNFRWYR